MRMFFKSRIILLVLVSLLLSGCAYCNIQEPLSTEFNKTEIGSKRGQSRSHAVLWLVAWGDGGVKAAAQNGGIKVIHHADTKILFILFGLYAQVTTVVYGD